MAKPPLKVIRNPAGNGRQPPRPLGQHGQRLWNDLTREFDFSDRAGQELLAAFMPVVFIFSVSSSHQ